MKSQLEVLLTQLIWAVMWGSIGWSGRTKRGLARNNATHRVSGLPHCELVV